MSLSTACLFTFVTCRTHTQLNHELQKDLKLASNRRIKSSPSFRFWVWIRMKCVFGWKMTYGEAQTSPLLIEGEGRSSSPGFIWIRVRHTFKRHWWYERTQNIFFRSRKNTNRSFDVKVMKIERALMFWASILIIIPRCTTYLRGIWRGTTWEKKTLFYSNILG